jgi:hypothetical protein
VKRGALWFGMTEEDERELRCAVMQADLDLKRKQSFWETPKAIAIIVGATAAIAGVLGYKIGSTPPAPTQIVFQPGAIQVLPAEPRR